MNEINSQHTIFGSHPFICMMEYICCVANLHIGRTELPDGQHCQMLTKGSAVTPEHAHIIHKLFLIYDNVQ